MRRAAILLALVALASCSPAGPRAASYFKAHSDEISKVLADCAAGANRSAECDNARTAKAQIDSDKRLSLYKKGF
jgi:hypothetical protein